MDGTRATKKHKGEGNVYSPPNINQMKKDERACRNHRGDEKYLKNIS
jgi:hypothetical protein